MKRMKKKLLTILITSLVMIAGMGAFLWKMNSVNRQQEKKKAALLQEEMDTDTKDKALEDVDKLELQTLYLSGDKKNVVTREYGSVDAIYNKAKSAAAEDMLTDIKKKRDYSEEDPLWAYNPYGTNPESLYMYLKADFTAGIQFLWMMTRFRTLHGRWITEPPVMLQWSMNTRSLDWYRTKQII